MGSCFSTQYKTQKQKNIEKVKPTQKHETISQKLKQAIHYQPSRDPYKNIPQAQLGYISRKYTHICGSQTNQMNSSQFSKFFSHLEFSKHSQEKMYKIFSGGRNDIDYDHLRNFIGQIYQKSANQIEDFLFNFYFKGNQQFNSFKKQSSLYIENTKIKVFDSKAKALEKLKAYNQLQEAINARSEQQIKVWLSKYVQHNKFRRIFIQYDILNSERSLQQKFRSEQKKKHSEVCIVSKKWVQKLNLYLSNKDYDDEVLQEKQSLSKLVMPVNDDKNKGDKSFLRKVFRKKSSVKYSALFSHKNSSFSIQQTGNYHPGEIDNYDITGTFPWQLRRSIRLNTDYQVLSAELYEELQILFGGGPKFQRKRQNDGIQLYPVFIKIFEYELYSELTFSDSNLLSLNPDQSVQTLYQILMRNQDVLYYYRKMGRKWQPISFSNKGKIADYFSNSCFIVSVAKKDQEAFSKGSLMSSNKYYTIGDIYESKKQNKEGIKDQVIITLVTKRNITFVCFQGKGHQQKTYTIEAFESSFKKTTLKRLNTFTEKSIRSGIQNLGNTCYLASSVQMLIHTRSKNLFNPNKQFGKQLLHIIDKIQLQNTNILPSRFKEVVDRNLSFFRGKDQHHAYLILSKIDKKRINQNSFSTKLSKNFTLPEKA